MAWHNTGCLVIHNRSDDRYNVVCGEHPWQKRALGVGAELSFNGEKFPWCADSFEIRTKAFLFFKGALIGGTAMFYMFQTYPGTSIDWTAFNGGTPSFENRRFAGASGASYVDVIIKADDTPSAVFAL
jgi:hypothetical protein